MERINVLAAEQFGVVGYGAHLVVTLAGELDQHNSAALTEALSGVLLPETSTLQIDASGVSFLDSNALRSLLRFHRLAESRGVRVTIDPASRIVRRLLEIVHLEHIFDGTYGGVPDRLPTSARSTSAAR